MGPTGRIAAPLALLAAACGDSQQGPPADPDLLVSLDEIVTWEESITLDENDEVITVLPRVTADVPDGYLVTDLRERQVRLYAPDGTLRGHFGVPGGGPGEFAVPPMASVRLRGGRILTLEFTGRVALRNAAGDSVLSTHLLSLAPFYWAVPHPDGRRVLLFGRSAAQGDNALVHPWDPTSGDLEGGFLPVPLPRGVGDIAWTVAGAHAALRDGTLAVVFATDPAVHLVNLTDRRVTRVPLPASGFRPLTQPPPGGDITGISEWAATFSRVSDVYWLGRDTLLVSYYDTRSSEMEWNLVAMTPAGEKLFEARHTPRLLTVRPGEPRLVFVHPDAEVPNRWIVARTTSAPR